MKIFDQWKIFLILSGVNMIIFFHWVTNETYVSKHMTSTSSSFIDIRRLWSERGSEKQFGPYLINTKTCKIPNLNPMDPSVSKDFKQWSLQCSNKSEIIIKNGRFLRINWTAIMTDYPKFTHCQYTPFHRSPNSDKRIRFDIFKVQKFWYDIEIEPDYEFVHVSCFAKKVLLYTNYYSFIFRENFEKMRNLTRMPLLDIERNPAHLNVLLVGISAVSRMNFRRHMNKTRNFLKNQFNSVEFYGFNKIEDGAFLNLVGLLTGSTSEDINRKRYPLDKLPLIWKDFAKAGYVTMYAEDNTAFGPFNYFRRGFSTQPTDFYLRPLMLAMESNKRELNHEHCFRNKLFIEKILDYTEDFLSAFRHNSHFGFLFLSKLTQSDPNGLSVHDDVHFRFLVDMVKKNLLENTVIVYFSDYGSTYETAKGTLIGKYEERLPFLMINIPKWIQDGRPELYKNLQNNAEKLVSTYDIHTTLLDILAINVDPMSNAVSKRGNGISLLRGIPKVRTCEKANIPSLYCACATPYQIAITDTKVKNASQCLLDELNKKIKKFGNICDKWKLEKVNFAEKVESPDDMKLDKKQQKIADYHLKISTLPGGSNFEGIVRLENFSKCRLVGEIKRLDRYEMPLCILNEPTLTGFCRCKKNSRGLSEQWKYTNQTFW